MEDNDAPEADATDTLAEAVSDFNIALIGAPAIVFSLLAVIAALASASEPKVTYQTLPFASADTDFGRIFSVVKAAINCMGLHSAGMSVTTTTASLGCEGIESNEFEDGLTEPWESGAF
jgi:hypothetical protein